MGLMDLNLGRQPSDMMPLRQAAIPVSQLRLMLAQAHPKIHRFIRQFANKPKARVGKRVSYEGDFYVRFDTYDSARSAFESFVNRNANKIKASKNSAKYYFPDRSVMTVKFKSDLFRSPRGLKQVAERTPGVVLRYDRRPTLRKPRARPEREAIPVAVQEELARRTTW